MDSISETKRLDDIAADSLYALGANRSTIEYSFRILSRLFQNPSNVLEMGPAEGVMTDRLHRIAKRLSVVDGSEKFCQDIRNRFPEVHAHCALFEVFETEDRFDLIVLGHVLEHVDDPVAILRNAKGWLAPGGRIFSAVPNSRSIHRQAAVIMGLLQQEDQLNEMDRHHGHRRVMNPESFRACFQQAHLNVDVFGGYWLKPVSSAQIEQNWTPEMLEAFMQLGERYPDIAGELYIVASARP
ncbi:MAG: class I SAM-dependent methyltransferase [Dokdonella sp.]